GQLGGPDAFAYDESDQADDRSQERSGEQTEQHRAPAKKCADRSEKFQVAPSHCFSRDYQLASDAGNVCYVIEHQRAAFDVDAIVAKVQRHIAERLTIDVGLIAFEHQAIFFPRKIIAPWTFFSAHHEIGVLAAFGPRERHRRVEPD